MDFYLHFNDSAPEDSPPKESDKPEKKAPECLESNGVTVFPAKLFHSDSNMMYLDYCATWKKEESSEFIVDPQGYRKGLAEGSAPPTKRDRTVLNPDITTPQMHPEWRARMIFNKYDQGGECTMTCEEAFASLGQTCRTSQEGSGELIPRRDP